MLIQFMPSLIMFAITLAFVTLFFIPVTTFKQKNELIRFYWIGAWVFMAMITAFAGGSETLTLLAFNTGKAPTAFLSALTLCFVLFVMFGWFRLSFAALYAGFTKWRNKRTNA